MEKRLPLSKLFYITFFRLPQSFIWTPLLLIIIQHQVLVFEPSAKKGTYLGLILMVGALATLFSQPIMGAMSDYFRQRIPFIIIGSLIASSLLLSMSFVRTLLVFAMFYVLLQIAIDIAEAPHYALISDLVPKNQLGEASGLSSLMTLGGQISGPLIAGFLIEKGMLSSFYLIAIAILISGALLLKAKVLESPAYPKSPFNLKKFLKSFWINPRLFPNFSFVLAAQFFLMLSLYTITAFMQFYVKDVLRVKSYTTATGILVSIAAITAAMGVYFIGRTADKTGFKKPLFGAGLLVIGVTFVLMFSHSFLLTLALAALFGIAQGAFAVITLALAIKTLPNKASHGKDLGIWVMASIIPQIIAPAIGGPILDMFNLIQLNLGYRVIFAMVIFYITIGMIFIRKIKLK